MNGENYISEMPEKKNWLKFENFMHMNKNPYKIYADFESILVNKNEYN